MNYPDFESPGFLQNHIKSILEFYEPYVFDNQGGFFHHFLDNGIVYNKCTRHLVSSTRFVFNYANAYLQTNNKKYLKWTQHGLRFLHDHHLADDGHYIWQLKNNYVDDGRAMAYGHAFVILAASWATRVGIKQGINIINDTFEFMELYFWEDGMNAYADERDESLKNLSDYRGQNANMHSAEAMIAAFESTADRRYLKRAKTLAYQFCQVLPKESSGEIWEHYNVNWQHDWCYNIDKPDDLFKPWGFQPGHQVEWAKLLLQLDELAPEPWYLPTAQKLFDTALKKGWDDEFGGIVYGYGPENGFSDAHKYFWVQAEALAAAWRIYIRTKNNDYRNTYNRLWRWCWDHLVDHKYGGWYRIVSQQGEWIEPYKSPAGKVDYHTMGACWDVLKVMGLHPQPFGLSVDL